MEILRAEALQKTYGQGAAATHALCGVSFSVEQGSFTAIVGRSGSGKTTLLNLLGGLDTPTAGQVYCRGQSLFDLPPRRRDAFRRRHIGYVFQFFNLIPEFTALENIRLPAYLDNRTPDEGLVAEILDKLELTGKAGRYPAELSGGEQQRVAVARALAQKPDLLLADDLVQRGHDAVQIQIGFLEIAGQRRREILPQDGIDPVWRSYCQHPFEIPIEQQPKRLQNSLVVVYNQNRSFFRHKTRFYYMSRIQI